MFNSQPTGTFISRRVPSRLGSRYNSPCNRGLPCNGCLLAGIRPSNMLVYLRDGYAHRTIMRTATLRQKLPIKFSICQSQYTDACPSYPSTGPIIPGAMQGSHAVSILTLHVLCHTIAQAVWAGGERYAWLSVLHALYHTIPQAVWVGGERYAWLTVLHVLCNTIPQAVWVGGER